MADSDGAWGHLAEQDNELASAWDSLSRLPEPGENLILDSFCAQKNIDIRALLRMGTKLAEGDVLAFAYDKGIKFRNMSEGRMWSYVGSEWPHMKIVRASETPTEQVIVCEGETDGARLSMGYDCDVAIMPGGARNFPETMAEQLQEYSQVLMGLDKDAAGEDGCTKIAASHKNTVRFPAPAAGDWADTATGDLPDLPDITEPVVDLSSELLVPAGVMLDMEVPDIASWLEHAILPIGGQLIIHGWAKSFKSFAAFDLLARLAQGRDWACFEPTEEPCRTAAIQFEIPWPYYHERVSLLQLHATEPTAFNENYHTWKPMQRPELLAGNKKTEDEILNGLVENEIQIVLIDPIRRATGNADLNAENEVRRMLTFFQRIQDQGISVVATHHDNKEGAKSGGGSMVSMTGSGAFAGDADTVISIETVRGDDPDTSPRRNMNFALRNAPAIGPRSLEIQEDGRILYNNAPVNPDEGAAEDDPDAISAPSI